METRALGATGLAVSALGLGAGRLGSLGPSAVASLLDAALDLGVTLVDTARSYGASEESIGRAVRGRRERFVLSTKVGYGVPGVPDWTPECIRKGVDLARRNLAVDAIDVVHLHSCPIETLRAPGLVDALVEAVADGRVRVAAYSGEGVALAHAIAFGAFGAVQTSVNLCDQRGIEGAVRDAAARGLGVLAKRPLANAPWMGGAPPEGDDAAAAYRERWRAMGLALSGAEALETALRFAAFAPGVSSAIAGVRSREHLAALAAAVERGPLPQESRRALEDAFRAHDDGWTGRI